MSIRLKPADALAWQCEAAGLPAPEREVRFHATRRWRFDLLWRAKRIAIEVDGGVFLGGRHTRGVGYTKDCEKLNEALLLGFRVLRVTPGQVQSGQALAWIERALR
jgi:very-short-patch-repair endonuclease